MIFGTWGGGHVGLYRATSTTTTTLQWDNFLCGYDNDNDEVIGTVTNPDPGDYLYARYTFDDPGGGVTWQQIAYTHDANGNLTGDGLYKYTYDAWNRLAGVWYHDCAVDGNGVPSNTNERVARYRYDGLFRRVSKQVLNQGTGVVFRSDDLDRNGTPDATGILAGDRHEHYYYAGWRLVETTNHVTGVGGYSYGDSAVLSQFVYGTQYIDEPVRYDRNTDASADDDCLDAGGSRAYFYHQDANWRTVALTGEDGQIVERVEYTAYGEPTLFGGPAPGGGDDDSGAAGELGNAMLVSTVGNPLLHQGLFPLTRRERAKPAARDASRPALRAAACPGFRDRETLTYHNRFRQYDSRSGRFMHRDPVGYVDQMNLYGYPSSLPTDSSDPFGTRGPTREHCDKLASTIRNLANTIEMDLNLWESQRKLPPDKRPPNTNYPRGCIDQRHQDKMNKNLRKLQERIDQYNKDGCNKYGRSDGYQKLLDHYKTVWNNMPKEPLPAPRGSTGFTGSGPIFFGPNGEIEIIIIPFPVMPSAPGCVPAGAGAAAGASLCPA